MKELDSTRPGNHTVTPSIASIASRGIPLVYVQPLHANPDLLWPCDASRAAKVRTLQKGLRLEFVELNESKGTLDPPSPRGPGFSDILGHLLENGSPHVRRYDQKEQG